MFPSDFELWNAEAADALYRLMLLVVDAGLSVELSEALKLALSVWFWVCAAAYVRWALTDPNRG